MAVSILALSLYSFILNISTRYDLRLLLRDAWIFLCAVYSVIDYVFFQIKLDPVVFIFVNKLQMALLPIILFLIIKDVLQTTGLKSLLWERLVGLFLVCLPLLLLFPDSMYFKEGSFGRGYSYSVFFTLSTLMALLPIGLILVWQFKRRVGSQYRVELWVFLACYIGLLLTIGIDGIREPLLRGEAPISVIAIFALSGFGVVSSSLRYKRVADRMRYLAVYDELTDTLKRKSGLELIEKRLVGARKAKKNLSVILFDINNFKKLNDLYGYNAGNLCLAEIAAQLKKVIGAGDLLCRTEGDEFLIVADGVHDGWAASPILTRILEQMDGVWKYENHVIVLRYRLGISVFPHHGESVSELLRNADESLIHAKKERGRQLVVYNADLADRRRDAYETEERLKETLRGDIPGSRFILHYQPKVDSSGRIRGVEGLVRWEYQGKLIYPGDFIEIAERTGLIHEIGGIVLDIGCRSLARITANYGGVNMALNLSPQQLNDPQIIESVLERIAERGIQDGMLELELTESCVMDSWNSMDVRVFLQKVRSSGIKVSIDDFGTGQSSFSRLLDLPADVLKIDRSFVIHLPENPKSRQMCRSMISLAHELGMKVVAEGVETAGQAEFLFSIDCDLIQGYYFHKPMPLEALEKLLADGR